MKDLRTEIGKIRETWGERLLILAHHYQRASVIGHADFRGDSLELSRRAATRSNAERIVFCGVEFMAESADVLTGPEQAVYMPARLAGCPMANMADAPQMEQAFQLLDTWQPGGWLPVVYVNSTAAVKACCGRLGGSACTSSNAAAVMKWVFDQGKRVLFVPDEHLGTNTAHDLGIPDGRIACYDPGRPDGGLSPDAVREAEVVCWKGFCIVHQAFTVKQIEAVRKALPDARIIVHPESPKEVVRLADAHGSTAQIIRYVEEAPPGSCVVVGTELNLVERLAREQRGRVTVKALSPHVCANMAKTSEANLLHLLETWPAENRVQVDAATATDARQCLERMLAL